MAPGSVAKLLRPVPRQIISLDMIVSLPLLSQSFYTLPHNNNLSCAHEALSSCHTQTMASYMGLRFSIAMVRCLWV